MLRATSATLFGALAALTLMTVSAPAADFGEGKRFPEIVFPRAADGEPASVNQYLGQKIMMHVFASW